jgi:hypothetical protein
MENVNFEALAHDVLYALMENGPFQATATTKAGLKNRA